jgi:1-acyl-sn-glycerol-3-phosphate acyltransferase
MKKAFKRLETNPGTVLSFAEGTRFTQLKHDDQQSPFKNLLRPKAGGIGIALSTMPFITTLLDFSISYESKTKSFWDFLCGRMSVISIKIRVIEIPKNLLGNNYSKEKGFRDDLKDWLYEIWEAKEEFLNSA